MSAKNSKSILRGTVILLAIGALAMAACGSDKPTTAAPTHPFSITADASAVDAKIVIQNNTGKTIKVTFAGTDRAGTTIAPGGSWTQHLAPGSYNYAAEAPGVQKGGAISLSGKKRYNWVIQ